MINLLPDQIKLHNKFARRNVKLIRYTIILAGTTLAIIVITALGILSIITQQKSLEKSRDDQQSKIDNYKSIEAQGQKLSDQIDTIDSLLNRQVKFSVLLPSIAKAIPSGAVLVSLNFNANDLLDSAAKTSGGVKVADKPFVIEAMATDDTIAATFLENIKNRTDLFTNADIISVTSTPASTSTSVSSTGSTLASKYKWHITINAYLKRGNSQQTSTSTKTDTPIVNPGDRKTEKAL